MNTTANAVGDQVSGVICRLTAENHVPDTTGPCTYPKAEGSGILAHVGERIVGPNSIRRERAMALVKSEVKGEIRLIFVDVAHLVDGTVIEQCHREIVDFLDKTEESNVLLHFGRVAFMSSAAWAC